MKSKLLSILLAGVMAVGLLSGCGQTKDSKDSKVSSESKKQSEAGTDKSGESNTDQEYVTDENGNTFYTDSDGVKWYVDMDGTKYKTFDNVVVDMLDCWNGGGPSLSEEEQYASKAAAAIRDKIGVTVIETGIQSNEVEKLNMVFASGEIPTMVNCAWWGGSSGESTAVQKAINDGLILDLTDLVPQYEHVAEGWEVGNISEAFKIAELDKPENEGRRYIIPCQIAGSKEDIDYTPEGIYVRKDVAKTLGVDPAEIKTTEQLLEFMQKADAYGFKDINGNDTITVSTGKNGYKYHNLMQNFREEKLSEFTLNKDGSISYDRLDQNFVDMNMFLWKLVNSGMMDVECFTQSDEMSDQKVSNGSILFTAHAHIKSLNRVLEKTGTHSAHPEIEYVLVGPLDYADGTPGSYVAQDGAYGSAIIFFSGDAEEEMVEAALTYLNYVSSKEGLLVSNIGTEGEIYNLSEDGKFSYTDKVIDLYLNDTEAYEKLRKSEGTYMHGDCYITDHRKEWFGDSLDLSLATGKREWFAQLQEDMKEAVPLKVIEGLSITAIASSYEGYADLLANCLDDDRRKTYVERAYFAETEGEAIEILKSYQEFISSYNKGELQKFLDWLAEAVKEYESKGYTIAY